MLTELEAIRAENCKVKNDLKLRESDMRIYHSKYHEFRTQNQVLREQLKNFQQQQNPNQSPIRSSTPNELDEIIQYLAIENTPDQSAGSSNEPLEPERPVNELLATPNEAELDLFWKDFWPPKENENPLYEEPRVVEVNSDSDENGNRVSQFDQYQAGDATKLPNPVTPTLIPTKSTKRRLFDESEGSVPKKSVRSVFEFTLYLIMQLFLVIDLCKELCPTSLNLKTLLRMIVNGFKCPKCKPDGSARFQTLAEYHGHMIGAHKLQHVCHYCPYTGRYAKDLRVHECIHDKNRKTLNAKYQCDMCPTDPGVWLRRGQLNVHRRTYH